MSLIPDLTSAREQAADIAVQAALSVERVEGRDAALAQKRDLQRFRALIT
jgi:hypothetical protein